VHKNLKPVPNLNIVALRLRQARLGAGLSQEKLGILAGIDEFSASARVNQYERGKHVPDFQMLERFAEVLATPLPYFYARDDALAEYILKFKNTPPVRPEPVEG
jgi:transcriptional regulator with XRE-family HTH domain